MAERKIQLLLEEMNKKCKTQDAAYMNIYAIKQICEIVYILATECCMKREKFEATSSESFQRFEHVLIMFMKTTTAISRPVKQQNVFSSPKNIFAVYSKKIQV